MGENEVFKASRNLNYPWFKEKCHMPTNIKNDDILLNPTKLLCGFSAFPFPLLFIAHPSTFTLGGEGVKTPY